MIELFQGSSYIDIRQLNHDYSILCFLKTHMSHQDHAQRFYRCLTRTHICMGILGRDHNQVGTTCNTVQERSISKLPDRSISRFTLGLAETVVYFEVVRCPFDTVSSLSNLLHEILYTYSDFIFQYMLPPLAF